MSLADTSARGAGATIGGQIVRFLIQLITLAVLARLLEQSDFGLYAMVMAIAGLATLLSDFGLSLATMQAHSATHAQRTNLFWANATLGLLSTVLVYAAAYPISAVYDDPRIVALTQVISITFAIQSLAAQFRAELARQLRFKTLAVADISSQACALAVAILVATHDGGYWALAAQLITLSSAQLLYLSISARWIPGLPKRVSGMRGLYTFGFNSGAVQLMNYFTSNIDTLLLGRFWGSGIVGIYSQAYQLFRIPLQQLAAPLTRVAVPILSRIENRETLQRYVERAQTVLVCTLGTVFIAAAATSKPLLALVLGPGWEAVPNLFTILAVGGVFQSLGYVYYWIFLARNLTAVQLRFAIISRTIMALLIAGGCFYGAPGVAVGSSLGLAINWLMLSIFALPYSGLDVRRLVVRGLRPMSIIFASGAGAFVVGLYLPNLPNMTLLLTQLGTFVALYFLGILGLRSFREDIREVVDTAQRMIGRRRI